MYTTDSLKKKVGDLINTADKFVFDHDRMLYKEFFILAEKFCYDNTVIIGGQVGLSMLLSATLTKDMFMWDLYTDDAWETSKKLADVLSTVGTNDSSQENTSKLSRTVALQTNLRHREFSLFVNARLLFRIYSLEKYRGVKLADLMGTYTREGYFTKLPIRCMATNVQLMGIYRDLYSPDKISSWQEIIDIEPKLFELMSKEISLRGVGHDEFISVDQNFLDENAQMLDEINVDVNTDKVVITSGGLRHLIVEKFMPEIIKHVAKKYVIVGEYALGAMGIVQRPMKLQIIADEPINEIIKNINTVVNKKNGSNKKHKITSVRYPLIIPGDFQITKHSIFIVNNDDRHILIDIFNSSEFEMIPYKFKNLLPDYDELSAKIGNPWVLLRYIFIDGWISRLVFGTDTKVYDRLGLGVDRANTLRKQIYENTDTLNSTFQLSAYAGVYISEDVAKKKLIAENIESKGRTQMYYPSKNGGNIESNNAESNHNILGDTLFHTRVINLQENVEQKWEIITKIAKNTNDVTLMQALTDYAKSQSGKVETWNANKKIATVHYKNANFYKYLPKKTESFLDFGCGSGVDAIGIASKFKFQKIILADIKDHRMLAASKMDYLNIIPGEPLAITDGTIDLVSMFHVIHHMLDDLDARLKDIHRILSVGGRVWIKDHDVNDSVGEDAVNFEHFVYMIGEEKYDDDISEQKIESMMEKFPEMLPMKYYSAEDIRLKMEMVGFRRLNHINTGTVTCVYQDVYEKI